MTIESYTIYDLGYNQSLSKIDNFYDEISRVANIVENEVNPISIASGYMSGNYDLVAGHIESSNFVSGSTGWQITADGDVEFNTGTFRGTLEAGSIHIPDQTTTNSFHTETDGDSYWGCNVANWASDNDNAKAYVLKTGIAKFQNIILSTDVVLSGLQAGSSLAIQYLTAGFITSKAIVLAVAAGTGDSYIAGGNALDLTNWRGGDATGGAIILGIDDSDSDKGKFFAGNYSTDQYAQFDGTDFIVNGSPIANNLFYGNGADGNVTVTVNETLIQDKYYNNLIVNAGVTLNTGGYRIFVKNTLTNNGTISRNGNDGGNGGVGGNGADPGPAIGGTAGAAGAALSANNLPGSSAGLVGKVGADSQSASSLTLSGKNGNAGDNGGDVNHSLGSNGKDMSVQGDGGNGGAGSGGAAGGTGGGGGTGGTATFATDKPYRLPMALDLLDWGANTTPDKTTTSAQSGGTGSGASGGQQGDDAFIKACGGAGGGSGGNGEDGGMVVIAARIIVNNGTISALGGDAGDGGNGGDGLAPSGALGAGGGGGGASGASGSGGVLIIIYSSITDSGTISVASGAIGSYGIGGAAGANGGIAGFDGAGGIVGNTGTLVYLQN